MQVTCLFRRSLSFPETQNLHPIGKGSFYIRHRCLVQHPCNTTAFLIFAQRDDGDGPVILLVTLPKRACWQPPALWYSVAGKVNLYWTKWVPDNSILRQPTLSYPQKQPITEITAHCTNLNTVLLLNSKQTPHSLSFLPFLVEMRLLAFFKK